MSSTSILAVAGSLRAASYNRALLRSAAELAPPDVRITLYEGLDRIPPFNADLEAAPGGPPAVSQLRRALAGSDGLLIATPEYNQSVPGVLKNAIDWLSRSRPGEGLVGLPVAVTGATTGPWGTRLAQTMLRQMLISTEALLLPSPSLYVRDAASVFGVAGDLADEDIRRRLADLLRSFAKWIELLAPTQGARRAS